MDDDTCQPMTLGNMRAQHLIVSCLNYMCGHTALIDVATYPAGIEVLSLARHMKCSNCGGKRVDVRPNWKEQPRLA